MITTPDPKTIRNRLSKHLKAVVGVRSPEAGLAHLRKVQSYIEDELRERGLEVTLHDFRALKNNYQNVIGRKTGSESAKRIIIGAHFDSKPNTPGADDNASGVAVLLEVAEQLRSYAPRHTIEFAAFNLEEHKVLGSTAYAKSIKKAGTEVLGMVSLEMVGFTSKKQGSQQMPSALQWLFPESGDFIGLVGNTPSRDLLRYFKDAMKKVEGLPVETLTLPLNGWIVSASRRSDHAPFWDAGYPALLITDTAFLRNPNYHQPSDTLDTLNLSFMARIAEGVTQAVLSLDSIRI